MPRGLVKSPVPAPRRDFRTMKSILVIFLAAIVSTQAADQPNILLLFADDLGRYASAYADPKHPSPNDIISTPAFDRVAKEGALFQNAFVSAFRTIIFYFS